MIPTPAFVAQLAHQVGGVIVNCPPTGVACSDTMHHGAPWPATSIPMATSVGARGLHRFTHPVAFQDVTQSAPPEVLRDPAGQR